MVDGTFFEGVSDDDWVFLSIRFMKDNVNDGDNGVGAIFIMVVTGGYEVERFIIRLAILRIVREQESSSSWKRKEK